MILNQTTSLNFTMITTTHNVLKGCCWWGRGLLQSKGLCTYGKLNYYLGARAAKEGRASLYPNIDFCLNPEAICASSARQELIWMSGLFEWIDRVQVSRVAFIVF